MKRPTLSRPPGGTDLAIVPRVFAVLAAILLVGSVALAALLPADLSLGQALHALNATGPEHLQHAIAGTFGHFVWTSFVFPVLIRPVWMIPVCLGLICVGGAMTAIGPTAARPKQRRS